MTSAARREDTIGAGARERGRGGDRHGRLWLIAVCLITGGYALVPLLGSSGFYMRGDTAAQFAPTWFHLGGLVRDGRWPPTLDPDAWAGGNYAAEALFGVYNPINIAIWLVVSGMGDLLVSVTLVKALVLVALAAGTHLLAREYGAAPWAAASVATALPFSGFTLFWDAGSWPSGLIAFTYLPWVLLTFRRMADGRGSVLTAFIVGALAITQGNPYGTLGVVAAGLGLLLECALRGNRRGLAKLSLVGVAVAAFLPLVYLPLLSTSDLTYRAGGELFANNGKLRPSLADIMGLSSPTFVPRFQAIIGQMQVPATYLAWFVVPLLPWLRFGVLREQWRSLAGIGFVGAFYLLLTIGPAQLWLFRWPLRLIEYFYLAVAVLLALLLSQGLHRDRRSARAATSLALVAVACWLAWSEDPSRWRAFGAGAFVLVLLTAALVVVLRRREVSHVLLAGLLVGGTGLSLGTQVAVFGENGSSRPWAFPTDVSELRETFSEYDGPLMQFARFDRRQPDDDGRRLSRNWDTYLAGSMYHVAGIEAINNYTGMGYLPFTRRLCLSYEGYARRCGYRNLWQPVVEGGPPLAELLKLETVVAQRDLARGITPSPGWEVVSAAEALVLRNEQPVQWPDSRLSWTSPSVTVEDAASVGATDERVRLSTGGEQGRLVFAMLNWPGYTATFDGEPVPIVRHPAGLLTVTLPAGVSGTLAVEYETPGMLVGGAVAALGGLLALGLAIVDRRTSRAAGARTQRRGFRRRAPSRSSRDLT